MSLNIEIKEVPENGFLISARDSHSGRTLGTSMGTLMENGRLVLDDLRVDAHVRMRGVGGLLLQTMMALAKSFGAHEMIGDFRPEFGNRVPVEAFYRKHGIEITDDNRLYRRL